MVEEEIVYGMRWSKLLCIKDLMEKENLPYQEAEAIVNEIEEKKVFLVKKENKDKKKEQSD